MLVSAASTSGQLRVFRPQSGLTHKRCAGIFSAALRSRSSIHACAGMLGE
ncbi:Uncharacterised protein [Vibrio cholerae]|uniref:Uncharacterized protein n=1 Tax=Vibrio cholerae TaxID=666 RepID=A0A655XL77_VIBCL|nr:Uncharacterised protein [Vibrio cholerae]